MRYAFHFPSRAVPEAIEPAGFRLKAEGAALQVEAIKGGILRLEMLPPYAGETAGRPSFAVVDPGEPDSGAHVASSTDRVTLTTDALTVTAHLAPLHLEVVWADGTPLLKQVAGEAMGWRGSAVTWRQRLAPREEIYGLGEKMGPLSRRGRRYTLWNTDVCPHLPDTDPLYVSIPFFISFHRERCYGLFFDNTHRSWFDIGHGRPEVLSYTADGGTLRVYLLAGGDMKAVLAQYSRLTGPAFLPPLWALGYHQSRYSYENQRQVEEVAHNLRRHRIPCDALYLDIHYMDGYRVFTFDRQRFPDPAGLVARLRGLGFRVVTIVDPGVKVDETYDVYREGQEAGYWATLPDGRPYQGRVWPGPVHYPDFTRPEVRHWWARKHQVLLDAGVQGIWNDMNEPSDFDGPGKTLPGDVRFGDPPGTLLHREVHNVYGLLMARATQEAFHLLRPRERPLVISRAGYAGIQRHAVVWTGDNSSWWEHLLQAIPMCLNLGLSGVPLVGTDVGGFLGHCDGELLTRWTQLGTFTPFFRNHADITARPQEPYAFGEPYTSICRHYIRWRYRLLPYLYTLAREATQTGLPIMRPMVLEFPHDPETASLMDQFMLGPSLLVAPVYLPGARARSVYLPAGRWIDVETGRVYEGEGFVSLPSPLERIPVLQREGSIVPYGRVMDYTGQQPQALEVVDVHPSDHCAFTLYVDDGESRDYLRGHYGLIKFECRQRRSRLEGRRLVLTVAERGEKAFSLPLGRVRLLGVQRPPVTALWNGQPLAPVSSEDALEEGAVGWYLDAEEGCLYVGIQAQRAEGQLQVEWEESAARR